ncbi:PAQR family membrane homeostasis protein TrhA [Chthonobacter albigriseus]|uniref:PAQR family membrane homeostasis protein TrhA n=1 Tax=Chthonobacter albigriseus TaxID=1683161 RepID=UPI0015EE5012|nr:hemolysin III family protein [Chthonobacter albigriseus]
MIPWTYSKAEIIADAIVHGVGLVFALVGIAALVTLTAVKGGATDVAVATVYGGGLVAMLSASFLYNLWPVSPAKWFLRRFDHSAIFVLIAATYTPFLSQLPYGPLSVSLFVVIWGTALLGVLIKCALPGRFDRLTIGLYLALGWSGAVVFSDLALHLSSTTLGLIVVGGVIYSAGVIFHVWDSLKFQNAIWHGFVVAGAACHYFAVVDCLIVARA